MQIDLIKSWIDSKLFKEIKDLLHSNSANNINQIQKIKTCYPQAPVNELFTFASLQIKHLDKLKITENWLLTDKNAQQASSYTIAKYNGSIMQKYQTCADLCCGIGMDLWSISQNKTVCYAVDLSKNILSYAKYNMGLYSDRNIIFQNIKAEEFNETVEAIFIDPDRRLDDKRSNNPFNMSPDLFAIEELEKRYPQIALKLSPMIDYDRYNFFKKGQLHFVQENNELKEILYCSPDLAETNTKRCVILPENIYFDEIEETNSELDKIGQHIYEPSPAIIKAHLIENLAALLNINKIDPLLALLSSDKQIDSPFVKRYEVVEIMPFSIKKLNSYIAAQQIAMLDIKTRGFSETVESFRRKLKLQKGSHKAVLFIVKIGKTHSFIICDYQLI